MNGPTVKVRASIGRSGYRASGACFWRSRRL